MEDLKSTITNITKTITKTSGSLLKTTKLSMSIANEESALRNIYVEIGKKVHEIYAYGGTLGKFFNEKYKEIEATELKIKDLKEQLDNAKGARTCNSCGKSAPRTSEFCPKCGAAMDKEAEAPAPKTDYSEYDTASNDLNETGITVRHDSSIGDSLPDMTKNDLSSSIVHQYMDTKKCAVCNYANPSGEKFCISCGRLL